MDDRTRTIHRASLSREDTVNGDSEEEDDDDEGVCLDHADVNDEGVDIGQQIGNDLVTFWKREIDKFAKDMTLSHLLLPGTFTSDQRKELHDYAAIYHLYHQSEGPASCRRIRISRCMPRITITSDQAHDLEGVQVARDVNGRLQCGFVTSYSNSLWTVKYADRVPTSP